MRCTHFIRIDRAEVHCEVDGPHDTHRLDYLVYDHYIEPLGCEVTNEKRSTATITWKAD